MSMAAPASMAAQRPPIIAAIPLSSPWPTLDPFVIANYHHEEYPAGNGELGVAGELLDARQLGSDFSGRDGWSMYHGTSVPGFPAHPHRGFETITIVPAGLVDHADSAGASARYGNGDVQWMTAGRGVEHGEMFPLLDTERGNTLKLFQLWLNLPAANKLVDPGFSILWSETLPRAVSTQADGAQTMVEVIAGDYAPLAPTEEGQEVYKAPKPPPFSWASNPASDLAIWRMTLDPGSSLDLPSAAGGNSARVLYFHVGDMLEIAGQRFGPMAIQVDAGVPLPVRNIGNKRAEILMLQARPIGEPVASAGPFVMNSKAELDEAFGEYRRTRFGHWQWPTRAVTHGARRRFARHASGFEESPPVSKGE